MPLTYNEATSRIIEASEAPYKTTLYLSHLNLTEIPKELSQYDLKHIREIDLSNNSLSNIQGLHKMKGLVVLDLSYNNITVIKGLSKLKELQYLNLSGNSIFFIKNIGKLRKLKTLNISDNNIQSITGLSDLPHLRNLLLNSNRITNIHGVEQITNLSSLSLENNRIETIEDLTTDLLQRLTYINLNKNPIKNVPLNNYDDISSILGYLTSIRQETRINNTSIKINLIGSGRIGKTQLLNYFSQKKYIPNDDPTHGINTAIHKTSNENYEAVIWDFGGQSYHHGFHYLFLRPNDFYIILWRNTENEDDNYSYWIGTARSFSGALIDGKFTAPLMLVQNIWTSSDGDPLAFKPDIATIPTNKILKKYDLNLSDIFAIDVKSLHSNQLEIHHNGLFLEKLNARILSHAKKFGILPQSWVSIKKKLDKQPIIEINKSKSEFKKEYAQFLSEDAFAGLLNYLEFSGSILYFREIPGLNEYVFPNPPRLSDWIYNTILDKNFKDQSGGVLSYKRLIDSIGQEKAQVFLMLMENFQLIFKKPAIENDNPNDTFYIIPQFLPSFETVLKIALISKIPFAFSLQFAEFLHEGVFFKFLSQYGEFIKDIGAYWKYGIIFDYPIVKHVINDVIPDRNELYMDEDLKKSSLNVLETIKVLVYYDLENRTIKVHIDEHQERLKLARKIFDFFVLADRNVDTLNLSTQEFIAVRNEILLDELRTINYSTNDLNYFNIRYTLKNILVRNHFGNCIKTDQPTPLNQMAINLLLMDQKKKLQIVFSYSHVDENYQKELDKHLSMLKTRGDILTWHDRKITSGSDWNDAIEKNFSASADIYLLMISADFLASSYIINEELPVIKKRLNKGDNIRVIPIFVRPCDTEGFEFMKFQGAQRDVKGKLPWLSTQKNRDIIYTQIVNEIKKTMVTLNEQS
ncbi:leucine-rich repeat protein [Chitinophaga tropicalis]|uniref:Leucine-rich repeat protein n=1 Tax=Chitinophaga tropicalis TaxID=2683588 RepID=A0A7K1UE12_9BACT|nr:leucine-rich repeat protein [Chitinophaga tropicalis]MVT12637.1 leucine-rich repeat protein [Chitinophaga tropicalis]